MQYLGDDYSDVDVEYDIIDGDDSVGLAVDYEFQVTVINEYGLPVDITEDLKDKERREIIEAIEEDLKRDDY
jgi:hypothetical protein